MSTKPDFERLLPHRSPMLMLSALLTLDAEQIHCSSIIAANNPLLQDDRFPASGGLELLAQAAGVLFGSRSPDNAARPGAIVQVKTFSAAPTSVAVGSELHIHAHYRGGNTDAALFDGEVKHCGQCLFSGALMIAMLPPPPSGDPQ